MNNFSHKFERMWQKKLLDFHNEFPEFHHAPVWLGCMMRSADRSFQSELFLFFSLPLVLWYQLKKSIKIQLVRKAQISSTTSTVASKTTTGLAGVLDEVFRKDLLWQSEIDLSLFLPTQSTVTTTKLRQVKRHLSICDLEYLIISEARDFIQGRATECSFFLKHTYGRKSRGHWG